MDSTIGIDENKGYANEDHDDEPIEDDERDYDSWNDERDDLMALYEGE